MNEITIKFVDKDQIRNEGCGDYLYDPEGNLIVKAYLKDDNSYDYAFLIAIHELVEAWLTNHRGIEEQDIDEYDRMIVERGGVADEAGNEFDCIYKKEHRFSENIERQIAHEMNIDWFDYYNYYI
jgi:hypothetical protein